MQQGPEACSLLSPGTVEDESDNGWGKPEKLKEVLTRVDCLADARFGFFHGTQCVQTGMVPSKCQNPCSQQTSWGKDCGARAQPRLLPLAL